MASESDPFVTMATEFDRILSEIEPSLREKVAAYSQELNDRGGLSDDQWQNLTEHLIPKRKDFASLSADDPKHSKGQVSYVQGRTYRARWLPADFPWQDLVNKVLTDVDLPAPDLGRDAARL